MGRIDKQYNQIQGVGALFNNLKDIVVSDFKNNCPRRITATYKHNGEIIVSIFSNNGDDEQKLFQGKCDYLPIAVIDQKIPDSKGADGEDRKKGKFSGFLVNGKPQPDIFAHLSYQTAGGL